MEYMNNLKAWKKDMIDYEKVWDLIFYQRLNYHFYFQFQFNIEESIITINL